jgi:hypothetical protein
MGKTLVEILVMPSVYDKMTITQLVRNINRLEWAAETTDDYKWAKHYRSERQWCIDILISKFCY